MITRNYHITPLENGYTIEHNYRVPSTDPDMRYEYKDKTYMFTDWSDVVTWINDNQITIPQDS
jgi:hypothetical protein